MLFFFLNSNCSSRIEELADMVEVINYLAILEGESLDSVIEVAKEEPVKEEPTDIFKALLNKYKANELSEREQLFSDYELVRNTNIIKNFKNPDVLSIKFMNDNNELICEDETERNSYVVFSGINPTKPMDEKYIYDILHNSHIHIRK